MEGSAVIHRKKNDLIHKDATYISVSQPLAGSIHLNNWNRIIVFQKDLRPVKATCNDRKWVNKLNIPPGFLHHPVLSVDWFFVKGKGPCWFTIRETTCLTCIDAARQCCWDSGLMLNITPLGKMVFVKCLSKLKEVFKRGRFELHESPQCLPSIPLWLALIPKPNPVSLKTFKSGF